MCDIFQYFLPAIWESLIQFRYIGGKREVAVFENHRQLGPIIKVVPIGIGKGACIAVLTDPNYEVRFFCTMYRLGI